MPITTYIVSLNSMYGEVNSIKHYVITVCHCLATVTSLVFSGYSNFHHKSSNWNIFESGVKHLTSNGQMLDQQFVYVVYNIKHLWSYCGISLQVPIILQQYCFPYNCGNFYTYNMSLNNALKNCIELSPWSQNYASVFTAC